MNMPATLLVVDDTPENLALMHALLRDHYRVKVANHGRRALELVATPPRPDLILLDIMMPGMDGYEVCRQLKADPLTRDIPVLFLTAKSEDSDEESGLALGAVDYLTKPIKPAIVMARIRTHLQLREAAVFLQDRNAYLEEEVRRRTLEVQAIQDVTILAMASLAETRDSETGNHIRRTQHYVKLLAEALSRDPRHANTLDEKTIGLLFKSAPLHDIGKIGIPDAVLLKPGPFDNDEMTIMKTHTQLGRDAIEHAERQLGMEVDFLRFAKEIAYSHQEKWDGSGYPEGWAGEEIPLSARLMALADVYDALISCRVYKPPFSHEEAREIICNGRGSHFDPAVVDAFLAQEARFIEVARTFAG
ncbi:MAG: two-component system response regulator [Azonexus sp.]|nr:two-component system response regulator [Azonexus sp.]MCK6411059.1 two-component system response regulator [Azonexus sp.]